MPRENQEKSTQPHPGHTFLSSRKHLVLSLDDPLGVSRGEVGE